MRAMSVDGDYVYYTDIIDGALMRVPTDRSQPAAPIASKLADPWGLVVTAAAIFVACNGDGTIVRIPRN